MEITCQNCGQRVAVAAGREPRETTRESTSNEPAAHVIVETSASGAWLLHHCLVVADANRE